MVSSGGEFRFITHFGKSPYLSDGGQNGGGGIARGSRAVRRTVGRTDGHTGRWQCRGGERRHGGGAGDDGGIHVTWQEGVCAIRTGAERCHCAAFATAGRVEG